MTRLLFNVDWGLNKPEALTDKAAKWQKLFPLGPTYHRGDFKGGSITLSRDFLATMVKNWAKDNRPHLPVDYFHRGASDETPVANDDKVASGWISDLELRDDGLWGLTSWTDKARAHILADELRYLSPTFTTSGLDRTTGKSQGPTLFGAALLNDPYLTELPRVAASSTAAPTPTTKPKEKPAMEKKDLCIMFGLPEDTDDATLKACVQKARDAEAEKAKLAAEHAAVVKLSTERVEKAKADNADLATALKLQAERIAKLETERTDSAVDGLIRDLESGRWNDGKQSHILAAQKDDVRAYAKALGVAEAQKFFSKLKAVKLTSSGISAGEGGGEETPDSAHAKLKTMAKEKAKADGVEFTVALQQVMEANTELVNLSMRNAAIKKN